MRRRRFVCLIASCFACACLLSPGAVFAQDKAQPATVTDPVCKMKIDPANAKDKTTYKGKTYYFCAEQCKTRFDKEPATYAAKEK